MYGRKTYQWARLGRLVRLLYVKLRDSQDDTLGVKTSLFCLVEKVLLVCFVSNRLLREELCVDVDLCLWGQERAVECDQIMLDCKS